MSKDLVIGLDCSTSACKAVVFDATGKAVVTGRRTFGLHHERSGWAEQNAEDWWNATAGALADAAKAVGADRIATIAITHQRETFVCLDKNDTPIRPGIVWMDMRATAEVNAFGTNDVHRITGKPPNPTPAWYKLQWLKKHEPDTIKNTAHLQDVAGYLVHKLTGEWASSWACVDPLGLINMQSFDYDEGLLDAVCLNRSKVDRIHAPGSIVGALSKSVAADIGLPAGLPIVISAGDGQSASLGCNVTRPGRAYLNVGTGTVSGVYADTYSYGKAYRTMSGPIAGSYILESFIGGGTANIVWFVEQLSGLEAKPGQSREKMLEDMAAKIPEGAEKLLSLPYWTGAMTPYWDGHARGAFIGLSGVHTKAHMYRAILESIALEQRLLTNGVEDAMRQKVEEIVLLGGGSRSPLWCQIFANVLGRTVRLSREQEGTALGAGIHAAAAAGFFKDIRTAADAMTGTEKVFEPNADSHARYADIFEAYRSIYPGLKNTFHTMAEKMP